MKVLLIDNYDSFTYNLYQYVGTILSSLGTQHTVTVVRNNQLTVPEIAASHYDRIIISPGPGAPDDPAYFGVCGEVIAKLGIKTPILGICLGLQGIAHVFGGKIVRAELPMHGKTSTIAHDGKGVFMGIPNNIEVMRYHSLMVEKDTLPKDLVITATTNDTKKEIMGIRHAVYPIEGIQFHPESFISEGGKQIVQTFITH